MARNHGQVLASIWSDPDWVALSQGAQRLYMLLLSQPKLTLVGLLTYTPSRWARLAADTTLVSIEGYVAELEASRFVLVDRDTDELLVRTLVRHDISSLANGTGSSKLIKGFWRAWEGIESRQLRLAAVREVPDALWNSDRGQPSAEAVQMRTSPPMERAFDRAIEGSTDSLSTLHSPLAEDLEQPGNSRGDAPAEAAAVDNPPARGSATFPTEVDATSAGVPPERAGTPVASSDDLSPAVTAEQRQQRLEAACRILTDRHMAVTPSRHSRQNHHRSTLGGKLRDHHQAGHQHLVNDPTLTAEGLANLLEPLVHPVRPAPARNGQDPYEDASWQHAARSRREAGMATVAQLRTIPLDPDPGGRARAAARAALRHGQPPEAS